MQELYEKHRKALHYDKFDKELVGKEIQDHEGIIWHYVVTREIKDPRWGCNKGHWIKESEKKDFSCPICGNILKPEAEHQFIPKV